MTNGLVNQYKMGLKVYPHIPPVVDIMLTWLLALGTIRYDKFELHQLTHTRGEPGLVDRVLALHAGSRGFDSHLGHMSERFFRSNRPGYLHPVSSELENSGIRVAVSDCSVTERRWWRPLYQTGTNPYILMYQNLITIVVKQLYFLFIFKQVFAGKEVNRFILHGKIIFKKF